MCACIHDGEVDCTVVHSFAGMIVVPLTNIKRNGHILAAAKKICRKKLHKMARYSKINITKEKRVQYIYIESFILFIFSCKQP